MIKNKKGIIIAAISLALIYFIICVIQALPKDSGYKKTVFLGASTKINIEDGNIKIKNDNAKIEKQKVKVYFNKVFVDATLSSFDADSDGVKYSYMVSNENGDRLALDTILVAHTDDLSLKIKEPNTRILDNPEEIYKFAKANNISLPSNIEITYMNVKTIDINDDNEDEYIYSAGFEISEDTFESIVFMKQQGNYILISKETSDNDIFKNVRLSFYKLIDFNNDNNYEFVVNKRMSEYGPDYYELYNFDGSSFTKIGGE